MSGLRTAELLGHAAGRDEHAAGRDQAGDAGRLGPCDRTGGAHRRLERLIEHRAVEIHRDRAHGARVEARRQLQHVRSAGYLPATAATYAATFAASAPVTSFGGMGPPPTAT